MPATGFINKVVSLKLFMKTLNLVILPFRNQIKIDKFQNPILKTNINHHEII